jgi:ribosomal protein S12 methylthiotransferase accessory factor
MHPLFSGEEKPKLMLRGTARTRSIEETLAAYLPLASRFGITRLADVTGLDYIGIPVYTAIRPLARSLSVSQGKGTTRAAAKASALMESIECWHAENISLPLRYASERELRRSDKVLDVSGLAARMCPDYDVLRPLNWVRGFDLFSGEPTWVPFDLVNLNFVRPVRRSAIFRQDSNGLASGNSPIEAVIHGLCEVIERDATAHWFADPKDGSDKETQVIRDTLDEENLRIVEAIEAAGLHVGVYDATSDLGVPNYHAIIFDSADSVRAMGYFWGFGCHCEPRIAVSRALTEAVQCRLTEIIGTREDILPEDYELNRDPEELQEMLHMLHHPPAPRSFSARLSLATETFRGDLKAILDRLQQAGIHEAAVVDLTKDEFQIPVFKVIVPALEEESELTKGHCGERLAKFVAARTETPS